MGGYCLKGLEETGWKIADWNLLAKDRDKQQL